MAISYSLAPIPKWYLVDMTGLPLASGSMFTYSSLNPTVQKFVYQDAGGATAWPDPILFDTNGTQGPFYWKFDSASPTDLYFIEVYDANGVLQWTINNYPNAGSGGGTVTTSVNINNIVTNPIFLDNIGASANPVGTQFLVLAPGAHEGLTKTSSNAGPDIVFVKDNTSATDQLQFLNFPGTALSLSPDTTPPQYLNYVSNAGIGETKKYVQFPITNNVWNLQNTSVTITIWARATSGNTSMTLKWFQFYGDGAGATAPLTTSIQTLTLTSVFTKYTITTTIPPYGTPTIGGCGNTGLFLQVWYPLDASTNMDFVKPAIYLGNNSPQQEYITNDAINAVIHSVRTGQVRTSWDTTALPGWILMNDGSIGSASSGASNRANIDTFPVYNFLYTNVTIPSANTYCAVTGYTGNAITDFTANRKMNLPATVGRVLAQAGTIQGSTFSLGQAFGEVNHQLTVSELATHHHAAPGGQFLITTAGATANFAGGTGSVTSNTADEGNNVAHNTMQPTQFLNYFIKL